MTSEGRDERSEERPSEKSSGEGEALRASKGERGGTTRERSDPRDSDNDASGDGRMPGVPDGPGTDHSDVSGAEAHGHADDGHAHGHDHLRDHADHGEDEESCGCGSSCGCGASDDESRAVPDGGEGTEGSRASSELRSDGGAAAANVDENGNLDDVEFTKPAEGVSQDVEDGQPDEIVNPPDGAKPGTPSYGIRAEMNDIETPEDKTWFMELDEAVIDEGRCIQCGTCVASCPSDSIGIGEDGLPELVKMCTGCSLCWDFCPRGGLRYERQWKITGGEDNVKGAGDPITEFSAKVEEEWREGAQDGGLVTSVLIHLLEAGEIDGALVATESDDEPWKAESFLATTPEELIDSAGSIYNQTMALGNLGLDQWEHKLPEKDPEDVSLALVGTPCEIEGVRALQDFDWDYASQEAGVRAVDYTIALMCTKNFNYERLMGEQLVEKRGIDLADVGKMDVLDGKMMVYDRDGELIVDEDVEEFHDAALKGCDECADFTGYCADLTVGSVGSSDEYSSVIVRTERGLDAWEETKADLDHHDLEDRGAIGGLQSWDKKKAFDSLERPFDPDAPRFVDYADHAENYGTELNPHEAGH